MFSLYIFKLIQENKSVSTINSALYEVCWVQKKVGQPQVSENPFVTQVADTARRILARPLERKKPLTADQVMYIISFGRHASCSVICHGVFWFLTVG